MLQENLKRLSDIVSQANNSITRDQFVEAFKIVLEVIQEDQDTNETEWNLIKQALEKLEEALKADNEKDVADIKKALTERNNIFMSKLEADLSKAKDKAFKEIDISMNFLRDKVRVLKDGRDGENGQDGKDGSPDTGEEIVSKINALPTDDEDGEFKIDASHIKNLPERAAEIIRNVGGHGAFYTLADVNFAGIIPGQMPIWDGVSWTPTTPSGGGGTPVYGEVLDTQGSGPVFNLAFTPIAGSVRLYRGGAYQSVAKSDYSITGGAITLASALQSGEVLVADYSH